VADHVFSNTAGDCNNNPQPEVARLAPKQIQFIAASECRS